MEDDEDLTAPGNNCHQKFFRIFAGVRKFKTLSSCPREIWFIYLMKLLESFAYFSMSTSLTIFLSAEFQYTDQEAGWAYGFSNTLTAVYGLPAGFIIIDNFGVKWSLFTGAVLLVVGRFIMAFTTNSALLSISLYVLLPLGQSFGIPVMAIGIRRYTTSANQSFGFSLFYVVMNVAALVAAWSVDFFRYLVKDGVEVGWFGITHWSSYRLIILAGALVTIFNLFISLFCIREIDVNAYGETQEVEPVKEDPMKILMETLRSSVFWRFVLFISLLIGVRLIYRHLDATFPKYMTRTFNEHDAQGHITVVAPYGSILGINPFLIIVLVPLVTAYTAHLSAFNMIVVGSAISAVSPFWLLLGPNYWDACLFVITLSIGEAIWSPRLFEYSATVSPPGREGSYMMLANAPLFAAPIIVGWMSGWLLSSFCPGQEHCEGGRWLWLIIALVSCTSPVLMVLFRNVIQGGSKDLPTGGSDATAQPAEVSDGRQVRAENRGAEGRPLLGGDV